MSIQCMTIFNVSDYTMSGHCTGSWPRLYSNYQAGRCLPRRITEMLQEHPEIQREGRFIICILIRLSEGFTFIATQNLLIQNNLEMP